MSPVPLAGAVPGGATERVKAASRTAGTWHTPWALRWSTAACTNRTRAAEVPGGNAFRTCLPPASTWKSGEPLNPPPVMGVRAGRSCGNQRRTTVAAAAGGTGRDGKTCMSGMRRSENWSASKNDATLQKA